MRIADCLNFKIFKDILNLFFLSIFRCFAACAFFEHFFLELKFFAHLNYS